MHHFSVWAPRRQKVAVQIGDRAIPMQGPSHRGFWKADVPEAGHGTDYAFLLDNDPTPYPDPRSFWQPKDVHSCSRVLDHKKFNWTDQRFRAIPLPSGIVYEMHVGTFTQEGTLDSAIGRLEYLCELGITHIELLPIASYEGEFSWGYDGVSPYAPDETVGGPDAVKRFVDACHAKGMAVILDVVYNHFGPAGNYTNQFGPYYTEKHKTPWGAAINLEEGGSDEVRRFFIDNALMWLRDYHFDGLRLDATHEMIDRSAMHFLEQLAREVEDLSAANGRDLILIAENDLNDPRVVTSIEASGYGMDAQWSDDFHHALFSLLANEKVGYFEDFGAVWQLAHTLKHVFLYDGRYSTYRKHDHGRPVKTLSYHKYLGFIQNHDQIGNRAKGERVHQIVGTAKARLAAGVVFTAPFIPMIFMGEEWGASTPWMYFADFQDEQLRLAVRQGRKRDFAHFGFGDDVPNPDDPSTFQASKLKWDELPAPEHESMLDWYRKLIRMRRRSIALNRGDMSQMSVTFDEGRRWIRTDRTDICTLINLADTENTLDMPHGADLLLSSATAPQREGHTVTLPPFSMAVYHLPPHLMSSEAPQ